MSRISKLKRTDEEEAGHGISAAANQQINSSIDKLAAKYKTVEDLWEQIGSDFSKGLAQLALETQTQPSELIQILARAAREPKPKSERKPDRFRFWFGHHALEALAFLIILGILTGLLVRDLQRYDTVIVNSDLPAFHVIEEKDLIVDKKMKSQGSFNSKDEVIGRYLVKEVGKDEVLSADHVSKSKLEVDDREKVSNSQILFLSVKAGAFRPSLTPPARVRLLFSPRKRDEPPGAPLVAENITIDDAIVLAVKEQTDSAIFTISFKTPQDAVKAASLLGTSDVFVSELVKK